MLKVYPASKVPADGIVVWGSNHVNQSMITSGSAPMSKEVGGTIIGDTMNLKGYLHIQVTTSGFRCYFILDCSFGWDNSNG